MQSFSRQQSLPVFPGSLVPEIVHFSDIKKGSPMNEIKKSLTKKKILQILAAVLAALLFCGVMKLWSVYRQVSGIFDTSEAGSLNVEEDPDILQNGERFYNLLVVGIDYDPNAEDGLHDYVDGKGLTDVIMYVQIDRDDNTIHILQIPRDSYIGEYPFGDDTKIPYGKINGCYAYGPDQDNLINNLATVIYKQFKLPIDNYVTIDMASFKTLLNTMGGITMYVPWDIVDKTTGEVLVTAGTHAVSGDTAEVILRNRNYSTADYQRLETQQYFYAALVRTFLEEYNIEDYYDACKSMAAYINTDLNISEIWGLYGTMTSMEASNIFVIRAPGGAQEDHNWCYGLDREKLAEILNTYFRDADMPVEADRLEVIGDWDYSAYGETVDEGKYLGSLDSGADGDPDDLLHNEENYQAALEAMNQS